MMTMFEAQLALRMPSCIISKHQMTRTSSHNLSPFSLSYAYIRTLEVVDMDHLIFYTTTTTQKKFKNCEKIIFAFSGPRKFSKCDCDAVSSFSDLQLPLFEKWFQKGMCGMKTTKNYQSQSTAPHGSKSEKSVWKGLYRSLHFHQ